MIPHVKKERRLSKIETLTLAKNYITALTDVIVVMRGDDGASSAVAAIANGTSMQVQLQSSCGNGPIELPSLIPFNNSILDGIIGANQDHNSNDSNNNNNIENNHNNNHTNNVRNNSFNHQQRESTNNSNLELENGFFDDNDDDPFGII